MDISCTDSNTISENLKAGNMILSVPNGSNVRSNHNIDMTTTNTSMFGILFEVG